MAKDSESKNPFLAGSSDFIRPNAIFNPPNYRNLGLYVLLYNEIKGSLADYGFSEHVTLDVFIDNKIKEITQIAKKIYDNRRLGLDDGHGLDTSKPEYKQAIDWMGRLLPCSKGIEKDADGNPIMIAPGRPLYSPTENQKNIDELDNFLANYEPVKAETQRVAGIMNKEDGMLSIRDASLLLDAKRTKVRQLYEYARANQDYKPGKIDKDGSPKSGIHAAAYYEAQNELSKKKRLLRRNGFFNFLKGAASVGCAAMMVVSGGALLSYGGFALTSIFGAVFSAAGVGASALGAVGSVFGFFGMKNFYKRWRKGMKKSFDMRLEIKDFIGPAYHGKELEKFLAANWGKDGKNLTLNEKKTLFMFDKALKAYFEMEPLTDENGKLLPPSKHPKFPKELKMYLPDEIVTKWKLADDKKWFNYVSDKNGGFQTTLNNFKHVAQNLEGKGEHDHTEFLGILDRAIAPGAHMSVAELASISDQVDSYSSKIGAPKAAERKKQLANKLLSTVMADMLENAYVGDLKTFQDYTSDPKISKIIDMSDTPNAKQRILDTVSFLATEKGSSDVPLSETVGANIGEQYTMRPDVMVSTCSRLDSSADSTIVTEIANAITDSSYTTKQHYTKPVPPATVSIASRIAGLPNGKAKDYLQFMYNKRLESVKNDKDTLEATLHAANGTGVAPSDTANLTSFAKEVAGLKLNPDGTIVGTTKTLQELRDWIMKPSAGTYVAFTDKEQEVATKLLDEQIESLERAQREKARSGGFNSVKNNSYTISMNGKFITLEELITAVNAITADKINSGETKKLYDETILKITPPEMAEYVKVQFSQKIENLLLGDVREKGSSDFVNRENGIANISDFMRNLQTNRFITEAQRERIVKAIEPYIESAFNSKLESMEELMLADYNKGTYKQILDDFRKKTYTDAGFIDYFNKRTISSDKILRRIERLERGWNLRELLVAGARDEVPVIIDANAPDTRAFLRIYFNAKDPGTGNKKERPHDDPLNAVLAELSRISTYSNVKCLAETKYDSRKPNGFIKQMTDFMNTEITATATSPTLDDTDKLAALLIIKKRTLAMFKLHMYKYIQHQTNPSSYVTSAAGSAALANIKSAWEPLLNLIDNEYARLSALPCNSAFKEGWKDTRVIVNEGTSSTNIPSFYHSDGIGVQRAL